MTIATLSESREELLQSVFAIFVYTASSDGKMTDEERSVVIDSLLGFGFSKDEIQQAVDRWRTAKADDFDGACQTFVRLAKGHISLQTQLIQGLMIKSLSDGEIHPHEKSHIDHLAKAHLNLSDQDLDEIFSETKGELIAGSVAEALQAIGLDPKETDFAAIHRAYEENASGLRDELESVSDEQKRSVARKKLARLASAFQLLERQFRR